MASNNPIEDLEQLKHQVKALKQNLNNHRIKTASQFLAEERTKIVGWTKVTGKNVPNQEKKEDLMKIVHKILLNLKIRVGPIEVTKIHRLSKAKHSPIAIR